MTIAPREPVRRNPWRGVTVLATAASFLAALLVYEGSQESAASLASKWGWRRPMDSREGLSPARYLIQLAREDEEWFKKRPNEQAPLARRIAEFRQGCNALILAEHRPLSPQDRQWLVRNGRQWASDLDKALADIENGVSPRLVRDKVNATARQIAKDLRARAAARG